MPRKRVSATAGPDMPPDRRVVADVARRRRNRIIFAVATPTGALLFIIGQIGAQTGWISIPGDPHHFLTQVVGFGVLTFGLTRWR